MPVNKQVILKQAERLKSHERRPAVDKLKGLWAQWSIGLMVARLDVNRLDGQ